MWKVLKLIDCEISERDENWRDQRIVYSEVYA